MGISTRTSALESRQEVVNDVLFLLRTRDGQLSPGRRREFLKKCVQDYGEPHASGLRKTLCPIITRQALRLIDAQDGKEPAGEQATIEHLVPRRVVLEALLSLPPEQHTVDVVQGILDRLTLTAIVTKEEDKRLSKDFKLTSKMPAGWCPATGCPLERYRVAGLLDELVVIGPLEGELTPPIAALLDGFPRHPSLVITKGK